MISMRTHSGLTFDLEHPDPALVNMGDIAIALSRIARYLGHTTHAYSVAEHCVRVSWLLWDETGDRELALRGLLHDAAEAYIGDITAPMKRLIRAQTYALDVAEAKIERAILTSCGLTHLRSGLSLDEHERIAATIKRADMIMLATEMRDHMGYTQREWPHPAREKRLPMPLVAEAAERSFLDRYEELSRKEAA